MKKCPICDKVVYCQDGIWDVYTPCKCDYSLKDREELWQERAEKAEKALKKLDKKFQKFVDDNFSK